jgi:SAM-dependent methyltransferase
VTTEIAKLDDLFGGERQTILNRLAEDERIIENGLSHFIEVGQALARIRANAGYRAAGYATFEEYCSARWDLSRAHGNRLMAAADVTAALSPNGDTVTPAREAQCRELAPLREDPAALEAAWSQAVEAAGGSQPTAGQVRQAVRAQRGEDGFPIQPIPESALKHPAPFSSSILRVVKDLLDERFAGQKTVKVLDPFAGTGRVHLLQGYGYTTTGVELEPEWAALSEWTEVGTALKLRWRRGSFDAIVTSPTYGNRLADSYDAVDPESRHSYHFDLGRELTSGNSGAMHWGDNYRDFHEKAWSEAVRVLKPRSRFILNIKDHLRDGAWQDVSAWHTQTLIDLGLRVVAIRPIATRGTPSGSNADVRSDAELVIAFDRREPK